MDRWNQPFIKRPATPAEKAAWKLARELREDDQNAAAYRLALRDAHDEGRHRSRVLLCDFCAP